ncbi:hypothetical protein [Foetidibacter luteolus]|uniref:hypothetical protein n=1 Tax=Foetidibacter luteolus TaxID=2608880 RepID=UPI00129BE704|nr:hypothetical protein [Foetidibacter luteolus]
MQHRLRYQRQNMDEQHGYEWLGDAGNTLAPTLHEPDRRRFHRQNGDQVLNMINYLMEVTDRSSVNYGTYAEKLIGDQLPLGITSELSVFRWLLAHATMAN